MGQKLHGDLSLDVGQGGIELVQLEDDPCCGEVHGRKKRTFRRDGYCKSELRTCRNRGFLNIIECGFVTVPYPEFCLVSPIR